MNNTLVKGLQVLEALARSERPLGVSELATMLELSKSNVHRLLQALVDLRYVIKGEFAAEYSASLKLWELGNRVSLPLVVRHAAQSAMTELLMATRESVHLAVLEGSEVLYIHKLDSPQPVRAYFEIGSRAPAHCVATGKAMLAWQPEAALKRFAASGLQRYTAATIVDPDDFLREMERVRNQHYAVNRGEWRDSVWAIGAPICDSSGTVVAALGISGPSSRIKSTQIKPLAELVRKAADTASREASARPGGD